MAEPFPGRFTMQADGGTHGVNGVTSGVEQLSLREVMECMVGQGLGMELIFLG